MAQFVKEDIAKLIDGSLPWPAVQDMMKSPKDPDRFDKYVEILQERVSWPDRILLNLQPREAIPWRRLLAAAGLAARGRFAPPLEQPGDAHPRVAVVQHRVEVDREVQQRVLDGERRMHTE